MNNARAMTRKLQTDRVFVYPVREDNSTVLGYSTRSRMGKLLWRQLSWGGAWQDGGAHILNPDGGEYLHVRTKPLADGCWYRVRCALYATHRWRGGVVSGVEVRRSNRRWEWVITVTPPST